MRAAYICEAFVIVLAILANAVLVVGGLSGASHEGGTRGAKDVFLGCVMIAIASVAFYGWWYRL